MQRKERTCSERSDLFLLTVRGLSQLRNSRLLVSANDVMKHFSFPGNIDFAADDQGAFSFGQFSFLLLNNHTAVQ